MFGSSPRRITLRGNKQLRLGKAFLKSMLASERSSKVIAGCGAYTSILAHRQQRLKVPISKNTSAIEKHGSGFVDNYAVSLGASLAVAMLPASSNSCDDSKLVLTCAQNERTYCNDTVAAVGMCKEVAGRYKSEAAFCGEEVWT